MRLWRGRVPTVKSDRYVDYVRKTGLAGLGGTEGNRGAWTFRREEGGETEFLVMSLWDSMDAIRRFVGPAAENAVYYPEDAAFLLELEPQVRHYEVAGSILPSLQTEGAGSGGPRETVDGQVREA